MESCEGMKKADVICGAMHWKALELALHVCWIGLQDVVPVP